MNILFISPYVPDLHAAHAGGVVMAKTLETLKKRHNVFVVTFCNDSHEQKLLEHHPDFQYVRTSKWYYIRKILTHLNMPNMFALRSDKRFRKIVRNIINTKHIDAIHAEYTAMGQYSSLKKEFPHLSFSLVEHDVVIQSYERQFQESSGLKKLYYWIERNKVQKYEYKYVHAANNVFAVSKKDAALLRHYYEFNDAKILNPYYGIDFDQAGAPVEKSRSLCFVGLMNREENHIAAMRLVRIFKDLNPVGWKLVIIGAHPKETLQKEESDSIHITGFVDDINAEIQKCQFAVFPLTYGAGVKIKVLLSFGLGLPVITSHVGAEGIDPDGQVILLAESDEEFREKIRMLIENESMISSLSEKSIQYVSERFNWAASERLLDSVYP